MTRERAKRLQRLARAQQTLAEQATRALAQAQTAHDKSAAEASEIIQSLNSDTPLHGLMTELMAAALNKNSVETHRLSRVVKDRTAQQRREEIRTDAINSRSREATRRLDRAQSRKALEALVCHKTSQHPRRGR